MECFISCVLLVAPTPDLGFQWFSLGFLAGADDDRGFVLIKTQTNTTFIDLGVSC